MSSFTFLKRFAILCIFLSFVNFSSVMSKGFKYQAVVRSATGEVMVSRTISLKISILQGGLTGQSVYSEIHSVQTDSYGLVNINVGNGSTPTGDFDSINWGSADYYLEVSLDASGGTNYVTIGSTQILSVPVAMYSKTAETVKTESDPVFGQSASKAIEQTDINNWNSAYNWGNHSTSGYLKTENDQVFKESPSFGISTDYINHWNLAYSWGSHLSEGYLKTETDPVFLSHPANGITGSDISHWGTAYNWGNHASIGYITANSSNILTNKTGSISMWTNDANYITNSEETDPVFLSHPANGIASSDISHWNLAYGWGNHGSAGYLTTETDPVFLSHPANGIASSDISHWSLAYGWGNHASAGYITANSSDNLTNKSGNVSMWTNDAVYLTPSSTNTLTNKSGNVSMWTNDANYIKNSEETDPVFVASPSHTITYTDINNWNNKSEFDGNYSSLTNAPDIANSTLDKNITLSTGGTMSIKDAVNSYLTIQQSTGLIGMGYNATVPRAQLEIGGTEGLLVRGTVNSGTVRALGAGLRMHWYPRKGTFRVGNAESSYWDDDGSANPKLALYSIAMGYQPRATAVASTAIGAYNQATGDYSLALGSYCQATQSHSIAIGTQAYATGIYSIALGSGANTNGMDGAMVFGDDCYFQTAYSSKDNELTMRFEGGYRLWSSYPDSTAGVYMRHGQSSWSSYCDRNLKTNFRKLDKEDVLKKVQDMPVTEWNYKKFDSIKYIGPMAQDFYAAFHLGGEDSLGINTICMDGVNMAAIQGLIKRTDDLNSEVVNLKSYIEKLEKELNKISLVEQKTKEQEETINLLTRKIEQLTKSSTLKAKNKKKMQKNAYFVKKTVFTE